MAALPIAFQSNQGRYSFLGTTSLVNCYAEKQGADAKAPLAVVPCDGTVSFSAVTDTPFRGGLYMEDLDAAYCVYYNSVWKVVSDGTATRIGIVPGTDRVQFARNQKTTPQIVIRADAGLYVVESDTVSPISDAILANCVSVEGLGGYIVYGLESGRFYISAINEATSVDALDFATAEQSADKLIRLKVAFGTLLIMSQRTIEPWVNTGASDFPFELRSSSSVIPRGLLAADSVVDLDNTVMWVGDDGIVYRLNGLTPLRISTHEVERAIQDDTAQSDITGFAWSKAGHAFYCLTGSTWTYCYDANTKTWHKRESFLADRWRHDHAFRAWNKVIVGDRNGGSLYYLDAETFTEAGDKLLYTIISPPMHVFPNGAIVDALHLDMATGQGLVSESAQGFDPKVMLSWSNDGGNTYFGPRVLELGKRGNYRKRVTTRRLGRFGPQGRVWKISISDPVGRALANVDAQVRPLRL